MLGDFIVANWLWLFVVLVIILVILIIRLELKTKKMQREEPLEEFAVVFGVRWDSSRMGLLAQEIGIGDDLCLVVGGGGHLAYRIYLGKATRTEHGIIEVQGKGSMYKGAMVPEGAYVNNGVKTGAAEWRLTRTQKGPLLFETFKVEVLEVRPVSQATQIQ